MKKIAVLLSSLLLITSLAACGGNENGQRLNEVPAISSPNQTESDSSEMENVKDEPFSSDNQTPPTQEQAPSSENQVQAKQEQTPPSDNPSTNSKNQIQITTESGNVIALTLNNSTAANDFYNQLPLEITVENYASNEKVFYPPNKLNTNDTPIAKGPTGTLAYYEPWGNVAIYYGDCGGASGLYALGNATSGAEHISTMSGTIYIMDASKSATASSKPSQETAPSESPLPEVDVKNIGVTVGNKAFTATLSDNVGVDAFIELLKNEPLTINMSDYSGFEKVGSIGTSLPSSNSNMTATEGDIILYNDNQICVFYGSNSWSYTRLAKIDDLSGWKEALDTGDVSVTFSLK